MPVLVFLVQPDRLEPMKEALQRLNDNGEIQSFGYDNGVEWMWASDDARTGDDIHGLVQLKARTPLRVITHLGLVVSAVYSTPSDQRKIRGLTLPNYAMAIHVTTDHKLIVIPNGGVSYSQLEEVATAIHKQAAEIV